MADYFFALTAVPAAIGTFAWLRSRYRRRRTERVAKTSAMISVYGEPTPSQMLGSVKRAYANGTIDFDQAAEMIDELLRRGA